MPPLKSHKGSTATADTLPKQSTPFVGRSEELAEIAAVLAEPACLLLTLVGPGGIGKTRRLLRCPRSYWHARTNPRRDRHRTAIQLSWF